MVVLYHVVEQVGLELRAPPSSAPQSWDKGMLHHCHQGLARKVLFFFLINI